MSTVSADKSKPSRMPLQKFRCRMKTLRRSYALSIKLQQASSQKRIVGFRVQPGRNPHGEVVWHDGDQTLVEGPVVQG